MVAPAQSLNFPERFIRALSVIDPRPDQHFLEIGCGTGILAGMIADKLHTGRITALDKSPVMIQKACARNQQHIASSRLQLLSGDIKDRNFVHRSFDAIIAFNVNFFQKSHPQILALQDALRPSGSLYIFQQDPPGRDNHTIPAIERTISECGFLIQKKECHELRPSPVYAIIATAVPGKYSMP